MPTKGFFGVKITRFESGSILPQEPTVEEGTDRLDRKVLLVYSGQFESMDGPVEIKDEDLDKLASNHNSLMSKLGRLAHGEPNLKISPPLQLDHSTSARDTVGRLIGSVETGEHVLESGDKVKGLYGTARFLGKENVDKVKDGRWIHVSSGLDLETHKIQELTITPFPAAAEASLLSKRRLAQPDIINDRGHKCEIGQLESGSWYFDVEGTRSDGFADREAAVAKCKEYVDAKVKEKGLEDFKDYPDGQGKERSLSSGGTMDKAKLKAHLMEHRKLSEADADKEVTRLCGLAETNPQDPEIKKMEMELRRKSLELELKRLEKEEEEMNPKEKGSKKMSAAQEQITQLSADIQETQKSFRMARKQTEIRARLSKLKSEGRITPAETKKIDIAKLSGESDSTIDAVFKAYETLEPRIIPGLMGSSKAVDLGSIGNAHRMSELERETRMNMSLKRSALQEGEKKDSTGQTRLKGYRFADEGVNVHIDATPHEHHDTYMEMESDHDQLSKLMDEGKHDEAKELARKMREKLKHMRYAADHEEDPEAEKQMSALADQLVKLHNKTQELAKLVETT